MFCLKACPRCRGDLYLSHETEAGCIQCGYELRPAAQAALLARIRRMRRRPAAVAAA
jgi:hypothetical protein